MHESTISSIKRVEFVSNRMLCTSLNNHWSDSIFPNAHSLRIKMNA
jgi:hypothetical protein